MQPRCVPVKILLYDGVDVTHDNCKSLYDRGWAISLEEAEELIAKSAPSMVDEAVTHVRGLIESGGLNAGERLPSEAELVRELGISRTALREAIGRLQTIGLVVVRRGTGMFVGERDGIPICATLARSAIALSADFLAEIGHFRCALECHTVRIAAQRANKVEVAELEMLLEERVAENDDVQRAMDADFRFHRKLAKIAGNKLMLNVLDTLRELLLDAMTKVTYRTIHGSEAAHVQTLHEDIIEAVRKRDPDLAEASMRQHMEYFLALVDELEENLE